MKIDIRVGGLYVTRDGRKAFVYLIENDFIFYKIAGEKRIYTMLENHNGILFTGKDHWRDIISEYQDQRLKKCIDKVRYLSTRLGSEKCDVCPLFKELAEEILKEIGK